MKCAFWILLVGLALMFASVGQALGTLAVDFIPGQGVWENKNELQNLTVGWVFTPQESITVTHFGVFDYQGNGLVADYPVGLWDYTTHSLIQQVDIPSGVASDMMVASADTMGVWRFQELQSSLDLTANVSYVIGALHPSFLSDTVRSPNGGNTLMSPDAKIVFDGANPGEGRGGRWAPAGGLSFPMNLDYGTDSFGANFLIADESAIIPEPSSIILFSIGIIGIVGICLRRRKRRDA